MSDHSITSLIEKLEGAEVGSRELNEAVALATGSTIKDGWSETYANGVWGGSVKDYTTSLDAALALADRVLPGCGWSVHMDDRVGWYLADIGKDHFLFGGEPSRSIGRTPALALTAAILKARV
jgi:hypothetical protein